MRIAILAALAVAVAAPPVGTPAAPEKARAPAAAAIRLSFKLDPRLSGPTYGGERWISPPVYQGATGQDAVEVQAAAVDARGTPLRTEVEWSPSDPEMVAVTPSRGARVTVAVKRPGQSALTLKAGAATRKLTIQAARAEGLWRVTISQ